MELQKISKRFQNLQDHLEKAYNSDIQKIIQDVFKEYDIFYKGTSDPVSDETFLNNYLFNVKEQVTICLGISQNGNKCCRKSQPYSNYCKMHFYLEFRNKKSEKSICNESICIINNKQNLENKENLEKIFIEDSFYYKDPHFIYDTTTFEKVGYIDTVGAPILTDDPFILE